MLTENQMGAGERERAVEALSAVLAVDLIVACGVDEAANSGNRPSAMVRFSWQGFGLNGRRQQEQTVVVEMEPRDTPTPSRR